MNEARGKRIKKSNRHTRNGVPSLVAILRRPVGIRLAEGWRLMDGAGIEG